MKQTACKKNRLTLKSEFSLVRENGKKQISPSVIMLYLGPETDGDPAENDAKCGVICSRRFDKRAVYRNRARRLLYEAFRSVNPDLLPCRIIFIPRRHILQMKMPLVAANMRQLLQKARLFKDDTRK